MNPCVCGHNIDLHEDGDGWCRASVRQYNPDNPDKYVDTACGCSYPQTDDEPKK